MRTIISVLAAWSLLMTPLFAHAELVPAAPVQIAPTLIISEVAWAGSTLSDADEWIELANIGSSPIDLAGFSLEGATSATPYALPSLSLAAGGTFVLSNYAAGSEKSVVTAAPDVVMSSVSLSNTALHLVLRDPDGGVLDSVSGTAFGTSGSVRASMERVLDSSLSWRTATTTHGLRETGYDLGTPGNIPGVTLAVEPRMEPGPEPQPAPALVPEPELQPEAELEPNLLPDLVPPITQSYVTITPPIDPPGIQFHDIVINEIDPSNEWVEYRNQTSNDLNTEGLTLEDASGRQFALTGIVTAHSYGVLRLRVGTLNNDGDTVRLRTANGTVVDHVGYGKQGRAPSASKGQTVSRFRVSEESELDFALSDTPTPGAQNIVQEPAEENIEQSASTENQSLPASTQSTATTSSAKVVPYKLIIAGQTSLYANQATTYIAVVTPVRETWGPVTWYADGEKITDAARSNGSASHKLTFAFSEPGIHVLTAISGADSGHVQASRTYTVRAAVVPETPDDVEASAVITAIAKTAATTSASTSTSSTQRTPAKASASRSRTSVGILSGLSGTVVAGERLMGVRKLLLENGVIVTLKTGKMPAIGPGDTIAVSGKYNTARTTFTAASAKAIRVAQSGVAVTAHPLSADDDREAFVNRLVSVTGTVGHLQGKQFMLQGDEDTQVYWKAGASLPAGLVQQGATVAVTGVLTLKSNEWTLLPRGAEDVTLLAPAPATERIGAVAGTTFRAKELASTGGKVALGALAVLLGLMGAHQLQQKFKTTTLPTNPHTYETEQTA